MDKPLQILLATPEAVPFAKTGGLADVAGGLPQSLWALGWGEFFDREYLYSTPKGDYFDNAERFIFFSKAVLNFCQHSGFSPDIIHHHEWQTGLIPAYLKSIYQKDPLFSHTAP